MAKDDLTVHLEAEDFAADSLQVHILQGRERISELFSFEVEVVCSEPGGLDIEEIGGASVAIVFERSSGETRRIHGMVAEVCDLLNTEDEYGVYRLQIVPRAWRLNMVETLDVYLDMSIPEIIERKLSLVGLTDDGIDYEKRLLESYPTREFVVQYRETDLQFVGRLAEHLGISYVFEHSKQCDTIVFLDEKGGFRPDVGGVQYRGRGERIDLFELQRRQRLVPSTYVARDYNYRTPSLEIEAQHALERSYAGGVVEYGAHITRAGKDVRPRPRRREASHAARLRGP